MTSTKAIFAVVLAVALFAGPASAQTSPTGSADERVAALEELTERQERLIKQQQALIGEQETLLNVYRCMFDVDVEVVPGGCPDPGPAPDLSEAEIADAALLCAGWRAETTDTQLNVLWWTTLARGLSTGEVPIEGVQTERLVESAAGYDARVLAIIPTLQSERLTGLFSAMHDAITAVTDALARGGQGEEVAAAVFTAADRLNELDAALTEICS